MNHQRYVLLAFVLLAILTGWAVQAGCVSGFSQFGIADGDLFGVLQRSSAIGLACGVVTFVALIRNAKSMVFADEVVSELFKVTWPTREETVRASTTVITTTLFTAGLLAFYDLIWKNLAQMLLLTS